LNNGRAGDGFEAGNRDGALKADLAFIGHVCLDEIVPFDGQRWVAPGSAVLCGAIAGAGAGARVSVVTRMAARDDAILGPMKAGGIAVHVIPTDVTTYMRVVYTSANVDEREMRQVENAGRFALVSIPDLAVQQVHLAGITDQEFDLEFVRGMKARSGRLSADMQSFVRQVDPVTGLIVLKDVPQKAEIASLLDMVKLDVVEAALLTGTDDLERAAMTFEEWGCPEIVITRSDGVMARVGGETYWASFSHRSVVGRTGRGDTTFAAYIARRIDHDVEESLRFAATLVSIKMEKPGPFDGTLDDVLKRMNAH
jgi:sugar/nucleoside kinase (ribokinase family)